MLLSQKITKGINGSVIIPGDKSISHRSIIIPSISNGITEIKNLLWSDDVINTLNAFKLMGVKIEKNNKDIIIYGKGLNSLKESNKKIYLGNSGTSARLLIGLLSSQKFNSTLTGDESLSKRPMGRIINPLEKMGAKFESLENKLPLKIIGQKLNNINYELELPSAQVKSGMLLAALNSEGKSKIIEKNITRNHTEIMLEYFGANIEIKRTNAINHITIEGKKELKSKNINVPSDLSSASFFIIASLINSHSKLNIKNININPSRDGILNVLKKMGAKLEIRNKRTINGELIGDIISESSDLNGCDLDKSIAKLMIDEFPILSIAASFAQSPSVFRGLGELRVKESDRLELIKFNLDQCGVSCKIENDDLYINPSEKKYQKKIKIKTDFDHRIAMSFAVMGTKLDSNLFIDDKDSIKTSFPNFIEKFNKIGGNLSG